MEGVLKEGAVEKIRKIKLLMLDVDGVLTDGGIFYNDMGGEAKRFDVKDGHGIKIAIRAGIDVALVSARESRAVQYRAKDLGIELVYLGITDKVRTLEEIMEKKSLKPDEIAYVGDDLVDLRVIKRVGFSACVRDASAEVLDRVDYVTTRPGGKGAVREVVEVLLKSQDKWDMAIGQYFS